MNLYEMKDGWVVTRTVRVHADDTIYDTVDDAIAARSRYAAENPGGEYHVAHRTFPLDDIAVTP
jgi:hypothetical protein